MTATKFENNYKYHRPSGRLDFSSDILAHLSQRLTGELV